MLKGRVQLIEVGVNSVLGLEGDLESCVYFIASGRLRVYRLTGDQSKSQVCSTRTRTHTQSYPSNLVNQPVFYMLPPSHIHMYIVHVCTRHPGKNGLVHETRTS